MLVMMLLTLAGAPPVAVDVMKQYLAADAKQRAGLLAPNVADVVTQATQKLQDVSCAVTSVRPLGEAKLSASSGDNDRVVVEWPAHKTGGAHRELYRVMDGKVSDVTALTTLAELSLRAGNLDGALQWANKALALDPGHDEALGVVARAAARLGDSTRAQKAIKDAASRAPEGMGHRVAAYEVALLLGKKDDAESARQACVDAVRSGRLDDGRCFVLRARQVRGGPDGSILRQELEEARGRAPSDATLAAARGLTTMVLATTGKNVDVALLAAARQDLNEASACLEALDVKERASLHHAQAVLALELRDKPCAGDAELAVRLDPTVADHRKALVACADAGLLWANAANRQALKDGAVDLDVEARAIGQALMKDKAVLGGRRLPAFNVYPRVRVGLRQKGENLEVTLQDIPAPKRANKDEDAVAAAVMVHQIYAALYGEDAPRLFAVRAHYAGDTKEHVFPFPDKPAAAWKKSLPGDKELSQLAKTVKTRPLD